MSAARIQYVECSFVCYSQYGVMGNASLVDRLRMLTPPAIYMCVVIRLFGCALFVLVVCVSLARLSAEL